MRQDKFSKAYLILYACGIIPAVWLALLLAPHMSGGLVDLVRNGGAALNDPFHIVLCEDSLKTVLIFVLCYGLGIGIYLSTDRNYRRREEHGSAKWGSAQAVRKKYADKQARQDIFFRADNFRDEPWYDDFQMYMAIGVCQPQEEHALQVRKALKVMGYSTHTTIRDNKTYVVPGEVWQATQEPKAKNHHDWER